MQDVPSLGFILIVVAPISVIIIAAIAQLFVRNALLVTGALFIVLLLASLILSKSLNLPWVVFAVYAVVYYVLSYIGTLIGTLLYKGYEKLKKAKRNK